MFPQSGARRATLGTRNDPLEVKQFSLIIPLCFLCVFFVEPGGVEFSVFRSFLRRQVNAFSRRSSIKHRYFRCTLIGIVVCDSSLVLMSWFSCYRSISCFDVCSFLLLYGMYVCVSFFFPPNPSARSLPRRLAAVPPPRRQHII